MSELNHKYSKEQIEILRTTSMHDILAVLGYNTEHTSSDLYFSPFRSERTPSFHIDDANHRWYDHGAPADGLSGLKAGGDTVDLVMRLKDCSFFDALTFLNSFNPSVIIRHDDQIIRPGRNASAAGGIAIEKVSPSFTSRVLLDYAVGRRCIPKDLLERYCSQVTYRTTYVDRSTGEMKKAFHYAVGFRHTDGSWTLRVPPVEGSKFKGKLSTGSNHTIILGDGTIPVEEGRKDLVVEPSSKTVAVFEGFFDYLSWMAWTGKDVPGGVDCVVLNGVTNTKGALPFLLSHRNVVAFLDNDAKSQTGELFSDFIRRQCEAGGVNFLNNSGAYVGHKDLGDAWTAECAARRQAEAVRRAEQALKEGQEPARTPDRGAKMHR